MRVSVMRKYLIIVISLVFGFVSTAYAAEAINKKDLEAIKAAVKVISPGEKAEVISPSPISGLYEVVLGSRLIYMSADGRYLVDGDMFDVKTRKDLSKPIKEQARKRSLDKVLAKGGGITYKAKDPKYKATVFTDIDCGYCRKLHSHMEEYNNLGIEITYLFMPRAGLNSMSYKKAVSAVCAEDPQKALTDLKNGKAVSDKTCDNSIAEQFQLARVLGIRGTPGIITETGKVLPGYMPPQRLLDELKKDAESK